jgi:hypothetical protein
MRRTTSSGTGSSTTAYLHVVPRQAVGQGTGTSISEGYRRIRIFVQQGSTSTSGNANRTSLAGKSGQTTVGGQHNVTTAGGSAGTVTLG